LRAEAAARAIENVAASVADGVRIDWDRAGAEVGEREERLIRHLRLIDSVATVYRTLPSVDEEESIGAAASDYPDGPRWGRLILLDRIGSGTSADVYRAWDAELQRDVALKLLRDDAGSDAAANARLLQEARRLARIKHPHVVNVYGAERHESRIGLWMELVRGRSLDEIVRQEGPFAFAEAARIGIDLCSALGAVHAAGLLHRDVKAQNVVREETGRTVLMDFGTGEELSHGKPRLAGTPLYLAPEVLAGQPATAQTDLYGVGVLLFHLVTGQFPVEGDSLDRIAEAHRERRVRAVRDVRADAPDSFARVVDRALSPEPSARYASASAMESALRQAVDARPIEPSRRLPWALAAVTVAAILALIGVLIGGSHRTERRTDGLKSVAVLPLKLISGGPDAAYLADGLTDQLITTLGEVGSLRVTSYQSVARFKGSSEPAGDVARRLGVDSVMEGSLFVQYGSGTPRVRVNLRLIRAGSDFQLWSGSFERPMGDLLSLEASIARVVAHGVTATLTPAESARLDRAKRTNAPAEQAYLEGLSYLAQNRHGAEVRAALDAFQRATSLDPTFAPAYAAAARTYVILGFDEEITNRDASTLASREARHAIELDPQLADAHAALADISAYYEWDWSAARAEYERAIALNASGAYARTQYARLLAAMGKLDAAKAHADAAVTVDPLTANTVLASGLVAYYARQYDAAAATLERVVRMDPRFPGGYFTLGRVYEAQRRYDSAMDVTDRALRLADTPPWRTQALRLRALAGQPGVARRGFQELQGRLEREQKRLSPEHEAYFQLALGDRDGALDLLDQAVSERDPGVLWMKVDPRLDPIRSDPRFAALLARLGFT
jgi:serine/threonine protein kinase/tetratricopeptide (TPR) repeat protein